MRLQLGVLADHANVGERGKLNILGEFTVIHLPEVPSAYGPFRVVARFLATESELSPEKKGSVEFAILRDADPRIATAKKQVPLEMQFGRQEVEGGSPLYSAVLVIAVAGVVFNGYGGHRIRFSRGDTEVGAVEFSVAVAEGGNE